MRKEKREEREKGSHMGSTLIRSFASQNELTSRLYLREVAKEHELNRTEGRRRGPKGGEGNLGVEVNKWDNGRDVLNRF